MGFVLIKVGRSTANDFQLDREEVSNEHLEVFADVEGNVYLTDLKTETGTFVNGEKITDTVQLNSGDEVRIANTIKFNWENAVKKAMANSFSVGSDARNDIAIESETIDSFHIQIYKDFKDNVYVKDLETIHGTYVNGHRVQTAIVLKETDRLKLGKDEYDWRQLFIDRTFPLIVRKVIEPTVKEEDVKIPELPKKEEVKLILEKKVQIVPETPQKPTPKNQKNTKTKPWKILIIILLINALLALWLSRLL